MLIANSLTHPPVIRRVNKNIIMMIMPFSGEEFKTPSYKKYKAEKFEKNKQKLLMIFKGVKDTSLKDIDKSNLIIELKKLAANF